MSKKSIKAQRQERRRKGQRREVLIWGAIGVGFVTVLAVLVWDAVKPAAGEAVPQLPAEHVPEGTDPGPFSTDPPTSGSHYATQYFAGFYEDDSPEAQVDYPEGYLVHSLEHGYVIFWYNCSLAAESCEELKAEIQAVMDDVGNNKVIAFPWESIDVPVAATSWGRILRFDTFRPSQARAFVRANRERAPEPYGP